MLYDAVSAAYLSYDNNLNVYAGQTYTYFIRALGPSGSIDSYSISVSVPSSTCAQSPGAFSLSAAAYCNRQYPVAPAVMLTWTASSNAIDYAVYRNGVPVFTLSGLSLDNNINIVAGQTYSYFVRARNSYGTTDTAVSVVYVPMNVCQ